MPETPLVSHISDTARWVAMYRAFESERPDAIFHDPYARRLAGPVGERIAAAMGGTKWAWPMIVRTAVMDEVIQRVVGEGADTVLNLAAGLDTRPWRLDLPSSLTWWDVDYPATHEYKREAMKDEGPKCRIEWAAADLADRGARKALFTRVGQSAKRVLVVSEGLLIYLDPAEVRALATDLHEPASFANWLIDLASPKLLEWIQRRNMGKATAAGGAPMKFGPAEGTAYFEPSGWREIEWHSTGEEARRLGREMSLAWLWRLMGVFSSAGTREKWRRYAGYALLGRV
ncbi:MAG TPA: SAM-dependent methyltransferase [Gemmatimonadales bacterium]|nr:SAM-dependent methyltransferase [Gemmatimonadales bacterium]